MATTLSYTVADFQPFTKIVSADMNSKLNDIKSRINWAGTTSATTGLGDDNIQSNTASGGGLTRSSKLKAGTANYVVINDSSGKVSEEAQLATSRGGIGFNPTLAGGAGTAIIVNNAETGFALGSPSQAQLTQSFSTDITTLTAGEGISLNDAVCLDLHNGTGSNVYRVFRCDSDLANRRVNFLGFALAAATVVPNIKTYTLSAALVASNVITTSINGRSYVTTYASSSDATLQAVATQIATDPDVVSAVVTIVGGNQTGVDDRVITVTSRGGLSLNMSAVVTAGASQPTVTVVETQAASGQNVRIRNFGLMTGMSGLSVGFFYYLSDTTGAITTTPVDTAPIFVGQALSTTSLFVNINPARYQFGTPNIFVRSHGTSTNASANATQDSEHYNFVSWSAGTSAAATAITQGNIGGSGGYNSKHYVMGGKDTSDTRLAQTLSYNKSSWTTESSLSEIRSTFGGQAFNGQFYLWKGLPGPFTSSRKFNGTTWSAGPSTGTGSASNAVFTQGGLLHSINGTGGSLHDTINSSDVGSTLTTGGAGTTTGGGGQFGSKGWFINQSTTNSYFWDGASWSSAVVVSYSASAVTDYGPAAAENTGTALAFLNGGSAGGVALNTSSQYNGTAWAAATSSTNSRASTCGSAF